MPKLRGNVFNAGCPSRKVLELLAEKWAVLVIHLLTSGPHRTAELRRRIGGVSEKMLIQTLRKLERHGFIERHDFGEVPPRVEYSLTTLGQSLAKTVRLLDDWVEANMSAVLQAQRMFDRRQTARRPTPA